MTAEAALAIRHSDPVLARLEPLVRELAEVKSIQSAKKIADVAKAAEVYAKQQQLGDEAVGYAHAIKVEALRRIGEMIRATPREEKAKGGQPYQEKSTGLKTNPVDAVPTLAQCGLDKNTANTARKLADLPPEKFEQVREKQVPLRKFTAHVSNNSGENEWYTPKEYITAARAVMGAIDCDPASSEFANRTVKAGTFFTTEDNGLEKKWRGKVWMNPPYAQPLIADFSEAVASKYESGEISEACVLVNNATETSWFQRMAAKCSAICFPKGRVRFVDKDGNPGAPLQGQAVLYFGDEADSFARVFSQFGFVVRR